ncbi:hypothetical protein DFH06DRAFT_1477227 [Mycena polygramma]|nr:hypothetical protein DFH06DRAFT_1477227 [Mycena polygramma]
MSNNAAKHSPADCQLIDNMSTRQLMDFRDPNSDASAAPTRCTEGENGGCKDTRIPSVSSASNDVDSLNIEKFHQCLTFRSQNPVPDAPAYTVSARTHPAIVCSVVVDHYKTCPHDIVSGFLHDTGVPHLEANISFKGTQEGMDVWERVIWYKDVTVARIYGCGTESPSAPIGPEAP